MDYKCRRAITLTVRNMIATDSLCKSKELGGIWMGGIASGGCIGERFSWQG